MPFYKGDFGVYEGSLNSDPRHPGMTDCSTRFVKQYFGTYFCVPNKSHLK